MDVCWEDAVRRSDVDIIRDLLSRGIDRMRAIGMVKRV
jgi:hypothetical protein